MYVQWTLVNPNTPVPGGVRIGENFGLVNINRLLVEMPTPYSSLSTF